MTIFSSFLFGLITTVSVLVGRAIGRGDLEAALFA
jgi:Na+-driven multidrug efflux pump